MLLQARYRPYIPLLMLLLSQHGLAIEKNGFDLSNSSIPASKIKKGGPPRDGIPSIDNPKFIRADEASFLHDDERIIGLYRNGIAKAYPLKILNWHEIVNDEFDGEGILVSYCPLCNTGMAFVVEARDFRFVFGVSGLLYNSDLLLYDRQTGSLWSQVLGKAIAGPLKDVLLDLLPSSHTTWREWRARHPDTLVLSKDTGFTMKYEENPYLGYDRTNKLYFSVEHRSNAYRNKELVIGISIGENRKAYPFTELSEQGLSSFADEFAGRKLTINWNESERTARLFDEGEVELPSVVAYWFAWYAFYPDTEIFTAKKIE